ncbi:choice-of-anchor J domain-containing protein [Roseibacillus persicicus]|uniref:choice-of-anchor J domain-containing protein n=1 Tax=Roseibacillus persicicus TaxID=454148 RepID=UPI00280FEABB|nr:choice-of-anchor J domain-containing protein [Roseibacillus persicicus]MDQ8191986.1 choice-of-anchor J domain-containing protein [Roseibacillus persicicus]
MITRNKRHWPTSTLRTNTRFNARRSGILSSLLFAGASLSLSALDLVYQDDFDGDGVELNLGTGAGMEVVFSGTSGNWTDNNENLEFIATTSGGSRAGIATTGQFDLSQGFRLEVTYNVASLTVVKETGHTTLSNRVNFGLVDELIKNEEDETTTRDVFGVSPSNHYGLGFNLTDSASSPTATSPPVGLNFIGGDGIVVPISNGQPFTVGVHTLVLEADMEGNWSYSIDSAEATAGNFSEAGVTFDLTRDYHFYAYGQNDESAFQIVSLTVEATQSETELELEIARSANGSELDFAWSNSTGTFYDLLSTTDLGLALEAWTPVAKGLSADGSGINTFTTALPADPKTFYVVQETEPLFYASFENDNGGFTAINNSTESIWEHGLPSGGGIGGSVTSGNGGSAGAWGTALTSYYSVGTDTFLRSPVIDLTNVTAASLSFAEAADFLPADTAEVYLIDDETDALIESTPIYISTDTRLTNASWTMVEPISLPASAYGQAVRLEFRFVGTNPGNFLGWYIDDVLVAED